MELTKDREHLVMENQKLVYFWIQRKLGISINSPDYEDLVSVGNIGLINAAIRYDPEKGAFSTYAIPSIRNEIEYYKKGDKSVKTISLDEPIDDTGDGSSLTLNDVVVDPKSDFSSEVESKEKYLMIINLVLNYLKRDERLTMLYLIGGKTRGDIAKRMCLTHQRISQIAIKAQARLKKAIRTCPQYQAIYSMAMHEEEYRFFFLTEDINQLEQVVSLLQNLIFAKKLPRFEVSYTQEQIMIQLPKNQKSFLIIAQIVQEIEEFLKKHTD